MILTNIYPTNKISKDMIRQDIELYLSFVILKNKEKFKFLKDKTNSYIIIDNGAGDIQYTNGISQSINTLLEAADYINADEIVLPDKPYSNESFDLSMKSLVKLPKDFNKKIAVVNHGNNISDYFLNLNRLVQNSRIDTIMISRDLYLPGSKKNIWEEKGISARLEVTKELIKLFKKYNTVKQIHWLGGLCMEEYTRIPNDIKRYIRSSDTGMYVAELSQYGNYNLKGMRPEDLVINLEEGNFEWSDVEKLIKEQKQILEDSVE